MRTEERPWRAAQRQGKGKGTETKDSTSVSLVHEANAFPGRKSLGAPAQKTAERIAWERRLSRLLGDSPAWTEIERQGGSALCRAADRVGRLAEAIARELDVYPTAALEVALMSIVMNDPAVWPAERR